MQITQVNAAVGREVADLRTQAGWSQTELAERLSEALGKTIDPTTVTRLERGRRPVLATELMALSQICGVPFDRLMGDGGPLERGLTHWSSVAEIRDLELQIAQYRVRTLVVRKKFADSILRSFRALDRFRQTGDKTGVAESLGGLMIEASVDEQVRSFNDSLDLEALLADAGVPPDLLRMSSDFADKNPEFLVKGLGKGTPAQHRATVLMFVAHQFFGLPPDDLIAVEGPDDASAT